MLLSFSVDLINIILTSSSSTYSFTHLYLIFTCLVCEVVSILQATNIAPTLSTLTMTESSIEIFKLPHNWIMNMTSLIGSCKATHWAIEPLSLIVSHSFGLLVAKRPVHLGHIGWSHWCFSYIPDLSNSHCCWSRLFPIVNWHFQLVPSSNQIFLHPKHTKSNVVILKKLQGLAPTFAFDSVLVWLAFSTLECLTRYNIYLLLTNILFIFHRDHLILGHRSNNQKFRHTLHFMHF